MTKNVHCDLILHYMTIRYLDYNKFREMPYSGMVRELLEEDLEIQTLLSDANILESLYHYTSVKIAVDKMFETEFLFSKFKRFILKTRGNWLLSIVRLFAWRTRREVDQHISMLKELGGELSKAYWNCLIIQRMSGSYKQDIPIGDWLVLHFINPDCTIDLRINPFEDQESK